jgi:hypothetical protein
LSAAKNEHTRQKLKKCLDEDRLSRVVRHMLTHVVGERRVRAPVSPPGRTFVSRLSYCIQPNLRLDQFDLEKTLANVADFWIFVDASFFDERTDVDVLRKLRVRNRLFVLPGVAEEIRSWAGSNPNGTVVKQVVGPNGDPTPELFDLWDQDKFLGDYGHSYKYYIELLGVRRLLLPLAVDNFEFETGAPPAESELQELLQTVHEECGSRAYALAKKCFPPRDKVLHVTDEAVVVAAVLSGIAYGKECMILGKDEDLLEQFYKLTSLLKIQLGARLFARFFQENEGRFTRFAIPSSVEPYSRFIVGEGNFLVERPADLDFLLPTNARTTVLYCWLMGDYFSPLAFCAEDTMLGLLDCRESHNGLNTELLGGMNCHIHRFPIPVPNPKKPYAAFVHDEIVPTPLVPVRTIDVHHAIMCDESTILTYKA